VLWRPTPAGPTIPPQPAGEAGEVGARIGQLGRVGREQAGEAAGTEADAEQVGPRLARDDERAAHRPDDRRPRPAGRGEVEQQVHAAVGKDAMVEGAAGRRGGGAAPIAFDRMSERRAGRIFAVHQRRARLGLVPSVPGGGVFGL
jgi:hypothetical protein